MRVIFLLHFYFMVLDTQVIVPFPQPQNVTVVSNNFDTVLHWSPGVGTPSGTIYSVNVSTESATKKQEKCKSTTINVSNYMKNIERQYVLRLWASHGNRLSSVIEKYFTPYTMTILGPPSVTLAGCGDCLNINISLPNRVSTNESLRFYKGIRFDIHWKKAGDEKVYMLGNMDSLTHQHNKTLSTYTYVLLNLERGGKYCVRAKPHHNVNKNTRISDWVCDFTSAVEERGAFVTSVAGWTAGFVLVGLGLLIITASLAYTGFFCKLKRSLPKTLMDFVSSSYLSPEEIIISVAKYYEKSSKPKHLHQFEERWHEEEVKENRNCRNDDHDDDEDDDEKENDCVYMYRPTNDSVSSATSSGQSSASTAITLCAESENSGGCSIEAEQTAFSGVTLSQLQHSEVTNITQVGLSNLRVEKPNPSKSKEAETAGGQMNKAGGTSTNINLFSVTLKSLQLEEEVVDEACNAKEISRPLLPLLLRELEEDALYFSKPQTGMPPLVGLQTHNQSQRNSQTDVLSQLKDSSETQTGYRAMHTGRMDPENDCLLDEEEEEDFSGYMGR
ncbi:interferon lambda receptor 1-like isoform X2 [Colossoma macropomum]|uniref:interferon lambda receptor 1-like isoform X2 n=1 Tax=Colossoma macropomum TaxID=42526 RepID=UPI001864DB43|nr:interferon lambda receptor 1-like isoform X2 [Colossoma macropomum]